MKSKTRFYRDVARMDMDSIHNWAKQYSDRPVAALRSIAFYYTKWDVRFRDDAETPAQMRYCDNVVGYADRVISCIASGTYSFD